MKLFLELVINGLSVGAVYALIALGFVIIFKATEVVNFAQGSLLFLGGFTISEFSEDWGFFPAFLFGVTVAAFGALLIERILAIRGTQASVNTLAIMTIGIDIIISAELVRRVGVDARSLRDPFSNKTVDLGGVVVAQSRVAAIIVGAILVTAFFLAFKYTKWGIAMRASAEDPEAAALMGIRRGRVSTIAWILAGVLATVAVVFLVAFPTPGLDGSVTRLALKAFPAAILGGLDSTGGAIIGGLLVGMAEQLTLGYDNYLSFLGGGFGEIAPYVIMIIVLLVRPSGLFGTKDLARV